MIGVLFILLLMVLMGFLVVRAVAALRAARAYRAVALPVDGGCKNVRRAVRRMRRLERRRRRDEYLDGLSFVSLYQVVIIFVVASIAGLILETIWVRIDMGVWQRRYGMIWGPFSPLYGCGAVLLTLTLWKLRKQPAWMVGVVSMILGSCIEQFTGVVMEDGFNATSWSYDHWPDAITKYVCLRMSIAWGLLGLVWCKVVLPELLYAIGEPKPVFRNVVAVVLTAFLIFDGVMTLYVTARKDARSQGVPPANALQRYVDERYDDAFFQNRFENLEFDTRPELM